MVINSILDRILARDDEAGFLTKVRKIKENDRRTKILHGYREYRCIETMSDNNWEELGRDIANNTHLHEVDFGLCTLDDHKMSFFFRGLTRSTSIERMLLLTNEFSAAAVQSMVPFLQNANNLTCLHISFNNIRSEGFNELFRALHTSPIEELICDRCDIETIDIDGELIPQNLEFLHLQGNKINSDSCREIAKLLQGGPMTSLHLDDNKIDDEGVEILVDALKTNTSLKYLHTSKNDGITAEGMKSFLRLVNDVSSINATMQSNHTLRGLDVIHMKAVNDVLNVVNDVSSINVTMQSNDTWRYLDVIDMNSLPCLERVQLLIDDAVHITMRTSSNPDDLDRVGKAKIRQLQLNSHNRKWFADCQGVTRSLYSEINPLHLPEVLALVSEAHGQSELYIALKSSIAGVISTVNRKQTEL